MPDFWNYVVSQSDLLWIRLWEHIQLTLWALLFATVVGVGLGLLINRFTRLSSPVLLVVNILQTVPSLALLGLMIPLVGIGPVTAIIALFLYALLPIVRNTYTGLMEVDAAVIEAARGMGMTNSQILRKVELPLALPTLFAGIKTAAVITVGVATLASLIAAGGLGDFIFRGISLNNSNMILAGAIPAALLALAFDFALSALEKNSQQLVRLPLKFLLYSGGVVASVAVAFIIFSGDSRPSFKAGFTPEFAERPDGYPAIKEAYNLDLKVTTLQSGLMYSAVAEGAVDVISAYSTDGRIKANNLYVLEDNRQVFPPYFGIPIIRQDALDRYPKIKTALGKLIGLLNDSVMTSLNYLADFKGEDPQKIAHDFLERQGMEVSILANADPKITIGGKIFSESYILAYLMEALIETYAKVPVAAEVGMGGTQICFEALKVGEIDLYPEYTGTAMLVLLNEDINTLFALDEKGEVHSYLDKQLKEKYGIRALPSLGFNNTYAFAVREETAREYNLRTIEDLGEIEE